MRLASLASYLTNEADLEHKLPIFVLMDLGVELSKLRRKYHVERIRRWIGTDEERFAELMQYIFTGEAAQRQKGAWVLTNISDRRHFLAQPYLKQMLDVIEGEGEHQGVYRSMIRVFTKCDLPEELHGRITEVMFAVALESKRSVAEKVFAILTGARMVKLYPELGEELSLIIAEVKKHEVTPAIMSSSRSALKTIAKAQRSG